MTSVLASQLNDEYSEHIALLSDSPITYAIPDNIPVSVCRDGKRASFLSHVADEVRPDVIVCVGDYTDLLKSGTVDRYPTIVSLRNAPNAYSGKKIKALYWEFMRKRLFKRAARVVFQTEYADRYYRRWSDGRSSVIPNPIKSGLPVTSGDRKKTVVNFCRLEPAKNLPLLIEAFSIFQESHPDYRLVIYGQGSLKDSLLDLISNKGLQKRASISSHTPDIHEQIKDAGMFVSSSNFEGISNSMLEAMAIGVPTISTRSDGGGAEQTINDGMNGLLVPKGDAVALADAMARIADNEELASRLSKGGLRLRDELAPSVIAGLWRKEILTAYGRRNG